MHKKILVSGIQATGKLHFGNYFGAMKQNIDLANNDDYESYIFIADYHALTTVKDKDALHTSAHEIAAAYIACGLDTSKATLFRQSSVPEHTELAVIFNNVVTMPYLMRAHAFKDRQYKELSESLRAHPKYEQLIRFILDYKDKVNEVIGELIFKDNRGIEKYDVYGLTKEEIDMCVGNIININNFSETINVGLLDYPVLMAADILMYQADVVPVGQDQKQHIEYARDIAGFYNRAWGVEQFKLPKEHIVEGIATVPGIDGEKMSKSKGNVISLFGSDDEVKKAVMGIVTDSASPEEKKNPDTNNIYNIHKLFLSESEIQELRAKFENGGYGYKQAKDDLLATIMKWREGKKEIFDDLIAHPEKIQEVLRDGGEKAKIKAKETMERVRSQVGLF